MSQTHTREPLLHIISPLTQIVCVGLRKKRAAPPPPAPRPLSSAISTQALERIVDSEESLTSDMDPSKPPSDIGAPSKASSDIDCPKANSDIGVSTQSMRQLDYTSKADVAMCESDDNVQQIRAAKTSTEARSKSDSIDRKLDKADSEVAALVEAVPKVEQARVATKRGKLARSVSSSYALPRNTKMRDRLVNLREVGKGTSNRTAYAAFTSESSRLSVLERSKLQAGSQRYLPQHDNSIDVNFTSNISIDSTARNHIRDMTGQVSRNCQKSRAPARSQVKSDSCKDRETHISFSSRELLSKKMTYNKLCGKENDCTSESLVKMQMLTNLEGIKCYTESIPECGMLESRYSPKFSHSNSYACRDNCGKKILAYSMSCQNRALSRKSKLMNTFKKPILASSYSLRSKFDSKMSRSLNSSIHSPKLGRLNTTKCYVNSIVCSENRDSCNSAEQYAESNWSPPPLSTLQIFAISTRPLDIQMAPTDSVPSDIDDIPSLPIVNHTGSKSEERKLSILEPPPPGLVSRQESNESWNRFLVQLNSILESRAGEFV